MRWVELDFENWDEDKNEDWLVSENELTDDERFRETLIRNAELCRIKNASERIDAIWLRKDVFVVIYKQRASLFKLCRFEIQKNQKFSRFFMNFRFFDSDELNSNSLSTFRRFDDSLIRDALNVDDDEIFARWEHND